MVPKICSIDGCDKPVGRGRKAICEMHYYRIRRHGDPNKTSVIVGDTVSRFWSYVEKTEGCWEWRGARNAKGYGLINIEGKSTGAHMFSLELALGHKRPEGLDTCHRCDNPPCVNPAHLYFGTRQQNCDDAWSRGRVPIGEDRPSAKVTEIDVVAMRNEYAAGAEVAFLSEAYGLKDSTIRGIVLGFKWKHAGGPITVRRGRLKKKAA